MSGVLDARYKHRNGTIFDFKMTIHYVVDDQTAMRLISDWISRHQYPECSKNKKFQWFHELVDGFIKARAAYIYRTHELFPLLDYESQSSLVNMLIWYKNRWNNKVTHFGPFGKMKKENWQDKFNEWERKWTQIKKKLGLELDQFGMLKNTSANNEKVLLQSFERAYRKLLEELFGIIRDLEKKLAECISKVGMDRATRVAEKIGQKLGNILLNTVTSELAHIASKALIKTAAKEVGKQGGKQLAKSSAKKIPIAGAFVGLGFGIYRLCQGEPEKAFMEVASGAASTVPGIGTAASTGIDAALLAMDIKDDIDEANEADEELSATINRLEHFKSKKKKLEMDFEFIKDVLDKGPDVLEDMDIENDFVDFLSKLIDAASTVAGV